MVDLTAAPTPPSLNDPATFNARAIAFLDWMANTLVPEIAGLDASDWFSVQSGPTDTTAGTIPLQGNDADFADLTANNGAFGGISSTGPVTLENDVAYKGRDSGGSSRDLLQITATDFTAIGTKSSTTRVLIDGAGSGEAARIDSGGNLLVGKTSSSYAVEGVGVQKVGSIFATVDGGNPLIVNRLTSDGSLINLLQDSTIEGSISVAGTTVSLVGAHLSRLSQIDGIILRGTVLTNLDEMCEWRGIKYVVPTLVSPAIEAVDAVEAQDAVLDEEGNTIVPAVEAVEAVAAQEAVYIDVEHRVEYFGPEADGAVISVEHDGETYQGTVYTEANEQLNRMAVSSVAGDRNVAGVFQGWDKDDVYGDIHCAMTGDFVIRIAAGTSFQRGDLMDSAGDGTARPQPNQDVIGPGTLAKITSTHITETYADGSFIVPCVLMAC